MTRKEMADQLKAWLGLEDVAVLDESAMIDSQLHWGTIDLLARTKCVVRCIHLQTLADVANYILPHDVLAIVDFKDDRPRARRDQTTMWPAFTLVGSDLLRINPVPSVDGELEIWAVKRPAKMSDDADSPGDEEFGAIPDEFQDAILSYAFWKLSDYSDDGGSTQGERYRIQYEGEDGNGGRLRQVRSQVNRRGTARLTTRNVTLNRSSRLTRGAWMG